MAARPRPGPVAAPAGGSGWDLQAIDQELEQAIEGAACKAGKVPREMCQPLWHHNLSGFYRTSAAPRQQAAAFRAGRRKVSAYAKSLAFQGTGDGRHTMRGELALSQTLPEPLQP